MSAERDTTPWPDNVVASVATARAVVVMTGAGISAESGVPTFRDAMTGLWARFDPMELATPEAYAANPARVCAWYDQRRLTCRAAQPNAGHRALTCWQERLRAAGGSLTLVTQNVDRLHQAAGSENVVELHGSLWVWRCTGCGREDEFRGEAFVSYPPRCACGGSLRPGVVWFGESLPAEALWRADRAVQDCDLFCSIGTSSLVYPAADFVHRARTAGATCLEINLEPTPISRAVDYARHGRAGDLLPALLARLEATWRRPPREALN